MFLVIEGLDGAGKSTQVKLIREEFARRGIETEYLHFPRFDCAVYGELIARFLRGELGDADQVDPWLVALIYAGDRKEAAPMIQKWLSEGKSVIVDRYVYSNIAYQCAKIQEKNQCENLRDWILKVEYQSNGIPRPDLTLFLDVPFAFTTKKLSEQRQGDDRDYLKGKKDIHEASLALQQRVRQVYTELISDPYYRIIDCGDAGGGMLPPEAIFSRISEVVFPK